MKTTKENLFKKNCVRTNSGIYFNFVDPKPSMVNIFDIAHALSKEQRFGNHLDTHYSVLQHSIHCAQLFPDLETLMHDASEYVLKDIPSPLKALLPDYKEIEHRITEVIAKKFKLKYPFDKHVKMADRMLVELEWETFVLKTHSHLPTMNQVQVQKLFLEKFKQLS